MVVGTSHDSFDLVAFTALPYLTVNTRAAPPAFSCKYLIAVSANNLGCKWIAFRPVGIEVCPMLLQVLFPAFDFKLYTFPNPLEGYKTYTYNFKNSNLSTPMKRHFMISKSCTCLFYAKTVLTVSKIDFWKTHIYIFQKKANFLPKIKKNPRRSSFLYSFFLFNHLEVFKCIYNSFPFFWCYLWHFCLAFTCVIVFSFYNSKFTFYLFYI